MRSKLWATRWLLPWCLLTLVIVALMAWLGIPKPPTQSADYAGWIQAIFSVVAIIAAVLLSNVQHRRERVIEFKRAQQEKLDRMMLLAHLLGHALRLVDTLPKEDELPELAAVHAKVFDVSALDRATTALERLGPQDVPNGLTLVLLLNCIGDLQRIRAIAEIAPRYLQAAVSSPAVWEPQKKELHRAREQVRTLYGAVMKDATDFRKTHDLDF